MGGVGWSDLKRVLVEPFEGVLQRGCRPPQCLRGALRGGVTHRFVEFVLGDVVRPRWGRRQPRRVRHIDEGLHLVGGFLEDGFDAVHKVVHPPLVGHLLGGALLDRLLDRFPEPLRDLRHFLRSLLRHRTGQPSH